jgi:hypothetical protein
MVDRPADIEYLAGQHRHDMTHISDRKLGIPPIATKQTASSQSRWWGGSALSSIFLESTLPKMEGYKENGSCPSRYKTLACKKQPIPQSCFVSYQTVIGARNG